MVRYKGVVLSKSKNEPVTTPLMVLVALLFALALVGCGKSSEEETAGNSVKQLPATAPVPSEARKAAQAAVDNDPKAETPRADGR